MAAARPGATRVAWKGMLDHVFLDAVGVLERALDDSLLQRSRHEDRLLSDLLSGDVMWETSVALPGDGSPPRALADVTLDWSTWSQSAWRSWVLGDLDDEPPEIGVEVVLRLQRLAAVPDRRALLDLAGRLAAAAPAGMEEFELSGVVGHDELDADTAAVEITFEGEYRLRDPEDAPLDRPDTPSRLDAGDPGPDPGRGPLEPGQVGDSEQASSSGHSGDSGQAGQVAGRGHLEQARQVDAPAADADRTTGPLDSPAASDRVPTSLDAAGAPRRGSLSPALAAGLAGLAGWVASALVRLGELEATFLPPDPSEPSR